MYKNNNLKLLAWIGGALVLLVVLLAFMKPIEKYYLENYKDFNASYELDFKGENLLMLLAKAPITEQTENEDGTDIIYTLDPTFFDDYVDNNVTVINVTGNSKFIVIQYYRGNELVLLGYENNKLNEILIENETRGRTIHVYNGDVTVTNI